MKIYTRKFISIFSDLNSNLYKIWKFVAPYKLFGKLEKQIRPTSWFLAVAHLHSTVAAQSHMGWPACLHRASSPRTCGPALEGSRRHRRHAWPERSRSSARLHRRHWQWKKGVLWWRDGGTDSSGTHTSVRRPPARGRPKGGTTWQRVDGGLWALMPSLETAVLWLATHGREEGWAEVVNAGQDNDGCDTYPEKRRRSGRAHDFEPPVGNLWLVLEVRQRRAQCRCSAHRVNGAKIAQIRWLGLRAAGSTALDRRHCSDSRACGPCGRNRHFMPLRSETGDVTPLG
jgi:hypothetical protein